MDSQINGDSTFWVRDKKLRGEILDEGHPRKRRRFQKKKSLEPIEISLTLRKNFAFQPTTGPLSKDMVKWIQLVFTNSVV